MVVYIEYAFLQNFLLDGALLWLSQKVVRLPVRWKRLFLSAVLGGVFAVVYPLLSLPEMLLSLLKWSVGLCLPLLAMGRVRTRKEWGRYALTAGVFLGLTFLFGGTLLGIFPSPKRASWGQILLFFGLGVAVVLLWTRKFYQKRAVEGNIYPCTVKFGEKSLRLRGFYDSGNLATKEGLPVCFLSAEVFYDLFEESLFGEQAGGQVCDEIAITTLAGEKKLPVYKGEIAVQARTGEQKKVVYFARSTNMIGREYKVLLNARIWG